MTASIRLALAAFLIAAASSTDAVHRSANGLGQVLIYPYYTTRGDHATLYSVTNTSDEVKAINVRFLEGKGGVATLDFHLYLAPRDIWTAALIDDGETARLYTVDESCTVPMIPEDGVPFRNFAYADDNYDDPSLDRAREGFAQMIEMGTVRSDGNRLGRFALPGENRDCDALVLAWSMGGIWRDDPSVDLRPPSGGLRGSQTLINVSAGRANEESALALAGFRAFQRHVFPGSLDISLADAAPPVSRVWHNGEVIESTWTGNRYRAVSAILATTEIAGEFIADDHTMSETEWVFTQPTKSHHVPPSGGAISAPYQQVQPDESGHCSLYQSEFWDREGNRGLDFATPPPVEFVCWTSSVVSFSMASDFSPILASPLQAPARYPYESPDGWAQFEFELGDRFLESDEGHRYFGLPGFGFRVTTYNNGVVDSALRAYATSASLTTARSIELEPTSQP